MNTGRQRDVSVELLNNALAPGSLGVLMCKHHATSCLQQQLIVCVHLLSHTYACGVSVHNIKKCKLSQWSLRSAEIHFVARTASRSPSTHIPQPGLGLLHSNVGRGVSREGRKGTALATQYASCEATRSLHSKQLNPQQYVVNRHKLRCRAIRVRQRVAPRNDGRDLVPEVILW